MNFFLLAVIVLLGFTVETAIGFGSTLIALTLAAYFMPIEQFLPIYVPVNYGLFIYIVLRHRRHIDVQRIFTHIVPAMGVGLPVGLLLFNVVRGDGLRLLYSLFVMALTLALLIQNLRKRKGELPRVRPVFRVPLLFFAGIMHGLYSTGGPMVVYYLARENLDKMKFRSTLCLVWIMMGAGLLINFLYKGMLTVQSLSTSALLCIPLLLGLVLGELLNRTVNEQWFRRIVFIVMFMAGLFLLIDLL
ncbi:MAG TPA: sulfite exporter TauE/SafE family protein [bacterium]|nr:sulfite exporter TauE/SafE family protein [bacterium]